MCSAWTSVNSNGAAIRPVAGGGAVLGPADQGDDLVDDVDGLEQALDDVGAVLGLPQPELGPPADDLDLVVDVGLQRLHEVERAGHAVDEGDGVHRRSSSAAACACRGC